MTGRILVATDESTDGRHAVGMARVVAGKAHARLTILRVVGIAPTGQIPPGRMVSTETAAEDGACESKELDVLRSWLGPDPSPHPDLPEEIAVAFGVPGIEIGRMADLRDSNLIVLGRRPRAPDHRLLLGETADALVRRCNRPVLAVPERVNGLERLLAALDGTDRCAQVLECARRFARVMGASLAAVTVEPALPDEDPGLDLPRRARSLKVRRMLAETDDRTPKTSTALNIRQGNPIEEILAEVDRCQASVLAVGYRRGGPPKTVGPTEIARNLLYAAPCAVLTVPL